MSRRRKPPTSRRHSPLRHVRLHHIAVAVRQTESTHLDKTGRLFTTTEREQAHKLIHQIMPKEPDGGPTT